MARPADFPPQDERDPWRSLARRLAAIPADEPLHADGAVDPPAVVTRDSAREGTRLGDFVLVRFLGRGAMGDVWEARQVSLSNKRVALKILRREPFVGLDPRKLARFLSEPVAAARVAHSGIISVHQVGEHEGTYFFVQELVEGGRSLADWIDEKRESNELPKNHHVELASRFAKIADALDAAHRERLIHRDIKPSNILLTPEGEPKVVDFGLAKDLEAAGITATRDAPGTLCYMSPEQVDSRLGALDARSDVFSLGVTLFEALTCARPFDGASEEETRDNIRRLEMPDPRALRSDVPRELALICRKALEKERSRRYASMRAFADDLTRFAEHRPILATAPSRARRLRLWLQRNAVATIVGAAVILVVVSATAALLLARSNREVDAANRELRRQSYATNLSAAKYAQVVGARAEADRRLAACPEDMRGWEWMHLRASQSIPTSTTDHGVELRAIACMRGGRFLSGGADGRIHIDAHSENAIATEEFASGLQQVIALDVASDGLRLAVGGHGGFPAIWDIERRVEICKLRPPPGTPERATSSVTFSPDGALVATAHRGRVVDVWDAVSGEHVRRLESAPQQTYCTLFSPDGRFLAAGTRQDVVLWDARSLEVVARWPGAAGGPIFTMAFSNDGSLLACAGWERTIQVWRTTTRELVAELSGQRAGTVSIAFDKTGRHLAAGSEDHTIRVWRISGGRPVDLLTSHAKRVTAVAFVDEHRLVSASDDGTVRTWRLGNAPILELGRFAPVGCVAFSPDGRTLASGHDDYVVRLWDVDRATMRGVLKGHENRVDCVRWSPRGDRIATCSPDQTVRVWDLQSGGEIVVLRGHTSDVVGAAWIDDATILSAAKDGSIRRWSLDGDRAGQVFAQESEPIACFALSDDGEIVLTATKLGEVTARRVRDGAVLSKHRSRGPVTSLGCLARMGAAACIGDRGELELWSLASARSLATLPGVESFAPTLAVSRDGERLFVAAGVDLVICDAERVESLLTVDSGSVGLVSIAADPQGSRVAAGGIDGRVLLFETEARTRP